MSALPHGAKTSAGEKIASRTRQAEEQGERAQGLLISGPPGGDVMHLSEVGITATAHGKQLLELGQSVDQVVHDYGDLCQSIDGGTATGRWSRPSRFSRADA